MTKRPRRRTPIPPRGTTAERPAPDIDYGHGAVEGEPGGAQPGPNLPPPNPPAAAKPATPPPPKRTRR